MPESLNYLASHSRNLEALLQTYRQINLTIQSVFFVLGTFLLARVADTESLHIRIFLELLLVSVTVFSNVVLWRFQKVINSRGKDVNWWHKQMIKAEQNLPPEQRAFTQFKIYQSRYILKTDFMIRFLDPEQHILENEIDILLDTDLDNVRKVINMFIVRGIHLLWVILVILSIGPFIFI